MDPFFLPMPVVASNGRGGGATPIAVAVDSITLSSISLSRSSSSLVPLFSSSSALSSSSFYLFGFTSPVSIDLVD